MPTDFFAQLKASHVARAEGRRALLPLASEALSLAKRAIFAVHRDDLDNARALLGQSRQALSRAAAFTEAGERLDDEGSYRAALEEHAEAALYLSFVETATIGPIEGIDLDAHTYLGALADVAGELQRRQVRAATAGRLDEARADAAMIETIVAALMDMDLEGVLRTKLDQAKNALRRSEDVLYDLSMRGGK